MSTRVVVTGASGGIGSAVCKVLGDFGTHVIGISREGDSRTSEAYAVDLADADAVAFAAAKIADSGRINSLIHIAAAQPMAAAGSTTPQQWQETLSVNVVSLDLLVGGLRFAFEEPAAVVAVSSVHARATTEGICAYATSKAALEGWVRAAALDLGPHIRTVGVTLGAVDGPKLQEGFARWGASAEARMDVLASRTPLKRIGIAEEVARAIIWLSSSDASFITGTNVCIDGGALARLGTE